MRIEVLICDHCEREIRGFTSTPYNVEGGPTLDICSVCQSKPFRRVTPSKRGAAIAEILRMALSSP